MIVSSSSSGAVHQPGPKESSSQMFSAAEAIDSAFGDTAVGGIFPSPEATTVSPALEHRLGNQAKLDVAGAINNSSAVQFAFQEIASDAEEEDTDEELLSGTGAASDKEFAEKYDSEQPQLLIDDVLDTQPQPPKKPPKNKLSNHQLIPANSEIQKLTDAAKDSSPEDRRTAIQKQVNKDQDLVNEITGDITKVEQGGPKERTKGKWMMVAAIVALIAGIALLVVGSIFTGGTVAVFAAMVGSTYAPVVIALTSGILIGLGGFAMRGMDHLRQRDTKQNLENLQKLKEELETKDSPYRAYINNIYDNIYPKYAEEAKLSNETNEDQARRKRMLLRDMESFHKWHEWKNVQKESKAIQDAKERQAVLDDFKKQEEKFYSQFFKRALPEDPIKLQEEYNEYNTSLDNASLDIWISQYGKLHEENLEQLKKLETENRLEDAPLQTLSPTPELRKQLKTRLLKTSQDFDLWKQYRDLKPTSDNIENAKDALALYDNLKNVQATLALYQASNNFLDEVFDTELHSFRTNATRTQRSAQETEYGNQINKLEEKIEKLKEGVLLYDPTEEDGRPT